jgi:hypothetical protein
MEGPFLHENERKDKSKLETKSLLNDVLKPGNQIKSTQLIPSFDISL